MVKLTDDMILQILKSNSGATYYIANLIKKEFKEWERKTSKVLYLLKKLERENKVERYETSYQRQISWKIIKKDFYEPKEANSTKKGII
jgi:hypothetical protein